MGVNNKEHIGSLDSLQNSASAFVSVPSYPVVFREALAPVYLSGICIPLCFAVFVHAPAPVHALS